MIRRFALVPSAITPLLVTQPAHAAFMSCSVTGTYVLSDGGQAHRGRPVNSSRVARP